MNTSAETLVSAEGWKIGHFNSLSLLLTESCSVSILVLPQFYLSSWSSIVAFQTHPRGPGGLPPHGALSPFHGMRRGGEEDLQGRIFLSRNKRKRVEYPILLLVCFGGFIFVFNQ